jgi:hypothetical protein
MVISLGGGFCSYDGVNSTSDDYAFFVQLTYDRRETVSCIIKVVGLAKVMGRRID